MLRLVSTRRIICAEVTGHFGSLQIFLAIVVAATLGIAGAIVTLFIPDALENDYAYSAFGMIASAFVLAIIAWANLFERERVCIAAIFAGGNFLALALFLIALSSIVSSTLTTIVIVFWAVGFLVPIVQLAWWFIKNW